MINLTGKFYILTSPQPTGGFKLQRGKILGTVHDLYPIYLCRLDPVPLPDGQSVLTVPSQTILSIEDLHHGAIYDDEISYLEEWRSIQVSLAAMREAMKQAQVDAIAQARKRAAEIAREQGAQPTQTIASIGDNGDLDVMIVEPDALQALLTRLQQGPTPRRPRRRRTSTDESGQDEQ